MSDPSAPAGVKKPQEASGGSSKKKNKVKKTTTDASGDGAPSQGQQASGAAQALPEETKVPKSTDGKVHVTPDGAKVFKPAKVQKPPGDQSKKPPEGAAGAEGEQKSKAQLKAERRAIQEAQRALKEAKKKEVVGAAAPNAPPATATVAVKKEQAGDNKAKPSKPVSNKVERSKPKTQSQLADETEEEMWQRKEREMLALKIDNSILNLGFQYFHQRIVGANARCVALLMTLKEVIAKYRTPKEKELSRDLEKNFLNPCIKYINFCRPLSTSMGNAIKRLKYHISHIPRHMTDEEAITQLQEKIDDFIEVNIVKAAEAVAVYANKKIDNEDVILVYAASSLIAQVLKTAYESGKRFRVIVVEGRPRSEGKTMLRALVKHGIPCSYVYIGSASHAMSEATKVLLGAAAMFATGQMHSRTGNAMIAALAKAYNIPVMVCCETYKFTEKVQLHSGDSNLHARGKDLLTIGHRMPILSNQEVANLHLLNVMYDVTGPEFITALVTELGMIPCTSVPVVLRRQEDSVLEG